MIVAYKFQGKINEAKDRLVKLENKICEQRKEMTTQQELASVDAQID